MSLKAEEFLDRIGADRFTINDLWHKTAITRRAVAYPTREWADDWRRELAALSFIEPAPGARGGEGWRVVPAVVEEIRRGREAETERAQSRGGRGPREPFRADYAPRGRGRRARRISGNHIAAPSAKSRL
jgi:hypothetical protein